MLAELHWLPTEQWIQFKILLLTYKCLHDKAPQCLRGQLTAYYPVCPLCSGGGMLLC